MASIPGMQRTSSRQHRVCGYQRRLLLLVAPMHVFGAHSKCRAQARPAQQAQARPAQSGFVLFFFCVSLSFEAMQNKCRPVSLPLSSSSSSLVSANRMEPVPPRPSFVGSIRSVGRCSSACGGVPVGCDSEAVGRAGSSGCCLSLPGRVGRGVESKLGVLPLSSQNRPLVAAWWLAGNHICVCVCRFIGRSIDRHLISLPQIETFRGVEDPAYS